MLLQSVLSSPIFVILSLIAVNIIMFMPSQYAMIVSTLITLPSGSLPSAHRGTLTSLLIISYAQLPVAVPQFLVALPGSQLNRLPIPSSMKFQSRTSSLTNFDDEVRQDHGTRSH